LSEAPTAVAAPIDDLEDLYEHAPCGLLILQDGGRISRVNTTLCTLLGRSAEDMVGKRFLDLLTVGGGMFYETHFAPLLRMQGFFNEVGLDLLTATGTRMPVIANATERRQPDSSLLYTRIALFQAEDRRQYERDLVAAKKEVERLNAALKARVADAELTSEFREQFIAVLGHDLRNPLAGIDGGRRILERMHEDPKSVRIFRMMAESITRMSGLIDNVMDFARGRLAGGIGLNRTKGQSLEPTLTQVVNELQSGYPERPIEMKFDVPHAIDIDHARLAQMLSNLLGNAITHGNSERPVAVEASNAEGNFVLAVINGGDPIPPAAMERLFQPFQRGEVQSGTQGLGLGLYIASEIAKAHGGTLAVTSDAQETRFTFTMPI
jgi:sigma-B regulation protein RsbU (phosphoserine phosphatase)